MVSSTGLADVNGAILSLEAWFTLTLITIELIYAVSLIMTGVVLTVVDINLTVCPLVARLAVAVETVQEVLTGPVLAGAGLALVPLLLTERTNIARPAVTEKALTVLQASSIVEAGPGLAPPRQTGDRGGDVQLSALLLHLAVLPLGPLAVQGKGQALLGLLALLGPRANLPPAGIKLSTLCFRPVNITDWFKF